MSDPEVNIGEVEDDVFNIGRSHLWDGDPVWDRQLFFDKNNATTQGPEAKLLVHEHDPKDKEKLKSPEMPKFATCGYDNITYKLEEGHTCLWGIAPGTVVQRENNQWSIVLTTTGDEITYYNIPNAAVEKYKPPKPK